MYTRRNKQNINLIYIRAAIEANTGIRLPLNRVRTLLYEEGLITKTQAENNARDFEGYSEFYNEDIVDKYSAPEMVPVKDIPDDVQSLLNEKFSKSMKGNKDA